MNTRLKGVVSLVMAAALVFCLVAIAEAAPHPRLPAVEAGEQRSPAAVAADPIEPSPFHGDLGDMLGWERSYSIHLDANDQFAAMLSATQPHVRLGLLPPTATSTDDDFMAWGDADLSNFDYLHYVAPSSGDYTLLVYCDGDFPNDDIVRFNVHWARTAGTAKSNIPGVALPSEGASGTLNPLENWAEVYRVALASGQGLHLWLNPGPGDGDVDLHVYNAGWPDLYAIPGSNEEPEIAASHVPAGLPESAFFRAPADGDYYPTPTLWHGPGPATYRLEYLITDPTTITATASTANLAYGKKLTVRGVLTEHDAPLTAQIVGLTAYRAGQWDYVADSETTTDTSFPGGIWGGWPTAEPFDPGTYLFTLRPTTNLRLRVSYWGVFRAHTPADSAVRDVLVSAFMPTPTKPTVVTHGRTFTYSGIIRPRQSTGTACPVVLKVERKRSDGSYYVYKTVKTVGHNHSDYTEYVAKLSVPYSGKWRIRALHPANSVTSVNGNAETYSGYRAITAR